MHEEHPGSESHAGHPQDKGEPAPDHGGHPHPGEVSHRDTLIIINGHSVDLARESLTIEFGGFTIRLSYSPGKDRSTGETRRETYREKEILITGPDKGEPRLGRPPGRLFINGKHIDFNYDPATGRISTHGMFSVHFSLADFARAYISANPNLLDLGHHHPQE